MKPFDRVLLVLACVLILVISILVVWGPDALSWAEAVMVAGGVITVVGLSRGRMSSNQDHLTTSPNTGGTPRLHWGNIDHQPMPWFFTFDAMLFTAGSIISSVSPSSSAWSTTGTLLIMLAVAVLLIFPGALLALRHPSGAFPFPRLDVERRFAHPRLVGLAEMWAGLVLGGGMDAILFGPDPFSATQYWLLAWVSEAAALCLVAGAPLLALAQFDRRR